MTLTTALVGVSPFSDVIVARRRERQLA